MTWRDFMVKELEGRYDTSRVLLPGQIPYPTYLKLLQRSDAHVYLTYPFVASWSLREALACGCAIVASDVEPVAEFIADGKNGLLVPALDPQKVASTVLRLLADDKLTKRLRSAARKYAEKNLDMKDTIADTMALIAELTKT
jgi:glycosyltransferase involved in cell wall biosynthesis